MYLSREVEYKTCQQFHRSNEIQFANTFVNDIVKHKLPGISRFDPHTFFHWQRVIEKGKINTSWTFCWNCFENSPGKIFLRRNKNLINNAKANTLECKRVKKLNRKPFSSFKGAIKSKLSHKYNNGMVKHKLPGKSSSDPHSILHWQWGIEREINTEVLQNDTHPCLNKW